MSAEVLFGADEISERVEALAGEIAATKPDVAAPILAGGFVFAADLMRALARQGVSLGCEMLWLRCYDKRAPGEKVQVIAGPTEAVRGKTVLLIDGVLDRGTTIETARALLKAAGARKVITAVAVDKLRAEAVAHADFALFHGVADFVAGYGMDDDGRDRGLPDIVRVR